MKPAELAELAELRAMVASLQAEKQKLAADLAAANAPKVKTENPETAARKLEQARVTALFSENVVIESRIASFKFAVDDNGAFVGGFVLTPTDNGDVQLAAWLNDVLKPNTELVYAWPMTGSVSGNENETAETVCKVSKRRAARSKSDNGAANDNTDGAAHVGKGQGNGIAITVAYNDNSRGEFKSAADYCARKSLDYGTSNPMKHALNHMADDTDILTVSIASLGQDARKCAGFSKLGNKLTIG